MAKLAAATPYDSIYGLLWAEMNEDRFPQRKDPAMPDGMSGGGGGELLYWPEYFRNKSQLVRFT